MKKLIFCIIAALFIVTEGSSQIIKSLSLSGGYVRARPQGSLSLTSDFDPISSYGYAFGATFFQSERLTFSTDIGFIRKGHKTTFNITDTKGSSNNKITDKTYLNYIYFAPRIAYSLKKKVWSQYLFIAPRADLFVSARDKQIAEKPTSLKTNRTINLYNEQHNVAVFGLNVGLGMERKIAKHFMIGAEAIFWLDITNAVNIPEDVTNEGILSRNKAFSVSLTLKYLFIKG